MVTDPFVGKMSYIKVVSGKLAASSSPTNVRAGVPERMGKLVPLRISSWVNSSPEKNLSISSSEVSATA